MHGTVLVRAVVGTLVEIGRGKMTLDEFRNVIKKKDRCVEIIFDVSFPFSNGALGYETVKRMLIPLNGSFAGDFKNGTLNFFAGLDDYNGKEYSNTNGFKYIEQLYKVLQQ